MTMTDGNASTSAGSTRPTELRDAVERGFVELGLVIAPGYDAALRSRRHRLARVRQPAEGLRQRDPDGHRRHHRRPGRARPGRPLRRERERRPVRPGARDGPRSSSRPSVASPSRCESVGEVATNPSGFALGAESQVILFMFLTSMTGPSRSSPPACYGISRREFSTPTSAGTIVLGETLGRFAFALFQGLFIVVATALLFGVELDRSTRHRRDRRRCSPSSRPARRCSSPRSSRTSTS